MPSKAGYGRMRDETGIGELNQCCNPPPSAALHSLGEGPDGVSMPPKEAD